MHWLKVVSFRTELFTEWIIHKGYREYLLSLLKIPPMNNRMIIDNDIYIDLDETRKIEDFLKKDIVKNANYVYDTIEKQSRKFIDNTRTLKGNHSKDSNSELKQKLQSFISDFKATICAIGIPTIIDLTIEPIIKNLLKEKGFSEDAFAKIMIPSKPIETFVERQDLIKLKRKIIAGGDEEKLIQEHFLKHGWILSTLFQLKLYDKKRIKKELSELNEPDIEEKQMLTNRDAVVKEAKDITKNFSEQELALVNVLERSVYFRTARLEWMNKACFMALDLMHEIAKRLNVSFKELTYMLLEEVFASLDGSPVVDTSIRMDAYGLVSDDKHDTKLYLKEELLNLKKRFEERKSDEKIKRIVACKGEIKGIAKVVYDRRDLHKVMEGDIMVTPLTTPDYVITMKLSLGIITDLGGITSHAAIVSREMKKPCIVGTRNATKVIKDYDIIKLKEDGSVEIVKHH